MVNVEIDGERYVPEQRSKIKNVFRLRVGDESSLIIFKDRNIERRLNCPDGDGVELSNFLENLRERDTILLALIKQQYHKVW